MICASVGTITIDRCLEVLQRESLVELRLDTLEVQSESFEKLFSQHAKVIATYRPKEKENESEKRRRLETLKNALSAGAAYVDIEFEADDSYRLELLEAARKAGAGVIISYHNFDGTPSREGLTSIILSSIAKGASIVKIACLVKNPSDNVLLLSLLGGGEPLVVIGMGNLGKITRIAAPFLGSPFTYASLDDSPPTAPGQMNVERMQEIFSMLGGEE